MPYFLTDNRLLAKLPKDELALLRPHLEYTEWHRGDIIAEPNVPYEHVLFPADGLASIVAITEEKRRLEVGIYGRDGAGPISCIFGVDRTPHQHFVQDNGGAWRIPVATFNKTLPNSPSLLALLMRYAYFFNIQTSYTALSNGSSIIGERLARWILMCHDRLDGDEIEITHEFLGLMLGVRRSGVTNAFHILEGARLIRASRGRIAVLDRAGLEETAGHSYGVPEAEYERLIGLMK